jgi:long-subunit acyl-CoA synthetase (AMP-forming)
VASGKLVPYVQVKVVDVNTGAMLGPHQRGQFHVKTPMIMLGYLREGHDKVSLTSPMRNNS